MLLKKKIGVNKIRKKFKKDCNDCKFGPGPTTCFDYLVCILGNKKNKDIESLTMSTAFTACSYLDRNYYYEDDF